MNSELDLCRTFIDEHPGDAARVLERLPVDDMSALLEAMPSDTAARLLEQSTAAAACECLGRMPRAAGAAIVGKLPTDVAAAILRRGDGGPNGGLLELLPEPEAGFLRAVLRYPEGTAGALMDPRAMAVADDITAGEARVRVRRSPQHLLSYLYVVDRSRRLAGVLHVRELMMARPAEPLAGVMERTVAHLTAGMSRSAILAHPGWSRFHAMPVVDESFALLGAIRYPTLRRLEDTAREGERATAAVSAVFALGELYWLGLSGLLEGLASAVKRMPLREAGPVEADHGRV